MSEAPQRTVPFNALAPGVRAIRRDLDAAMSRVMDRGHFLLGPELASFEQAFALYHGESRHTIGVASGTDALRIGLLALGIQPGAEVLVPANAGVPPVAAVVEAGAVPVFCEVDPVSHTLEPEEIERRATERTRAVLVVHLYGRVAQMDAILPRARELGLRVLEDCAQAHGARHQGQVAGTFGDAAAFSFYPTKNLGALGDGGALLTADPEVADRARLLRMYGWRQKYLSEVHAPVSRLDELQAAALLVKLPHLDRWNARRRQLAALYRDQLDGISRLTLPAEPPDGEHVYHLYVVRVSGDGVRDQLRAYLAERGIGVDVHYPLPAHLQAPYERFGAGPGSLPHTEAIAQDALSLPMYPELSDDDASYASQMVAAWAAGRTYSRRAVKGRAGR